MARWLIAAICRSSRGRNNFALVRFQQRFRITPVRIFATRRYTSVTISLNDNGDERTAKLAVIGMGKLGGEELNFASDVDVIYVYSSDQGEVGGLSLHEYFAKLCTQVTATLSEVTEDDVVFRVDLRLRPEGAKGAIANSLAQMERYFSLRPGALDKIDRALK